MLAIGKMDVLKVTSPLETKASQVLTPFAFQNSKKNVLEQVNIQLFVMMDIISK